MERITRFRAGVLLVVVALILGLFSFRLYAMQVLGGPEKGDNITTYITRTTVRAARGEILDKNGNKLVGNRSSYNLEFNHYVILRASDPNGELLKLAKLCQRLGIEYTDHFPVTKERPFQYTLSDYNSAWQGYFQDFLEARGNLDSDITAQLLIKSLRESYGIPEDWSDEDARLVLGMRYELTLRNGVTTLPKYIFIEDVSEEAMSAILELSTPGLKVEASTVREYYTKYAAHVLGYIGPMNADQMEQYPDYSMDALVGQSGFELAFEAYLHGTDGIRVDKTTEDGTVVESYYEVEPKAGNNVEVSLDLLMQMAAEDKLADVMSMLTDPDRNPDANGDGLDAQGAAVVALDVKTGQVLVSASYPTYDPAKLRFDYAQIAAGKFAPLLNRPLMATYPPGSTYKMAMVVAGIDSNTISRYDLIYDKGVYTKYQGFSANCLQYTLYGTVHGDINCMEAIKYSCNYFFYELADRMKIEIIDAAAKGLGLGEATGVELLEYLGRRANRETKAALFAGTDQAGWYAADQIMTGIGQSFNAFTPMQLASYVATLCNQGTRYRATFLNKVVSSDYRTLIYENKKEILSTMHISDEAYLAYTMGMEMGAHEPGGTGYSTFKDYPIRVGTKTGTAEVAGGSANGAFVCYAPADDPQIAIVIYGERVDSGSRLGVVAKAILDVFFDIDTGSVDSWENQVS